MRCTLRTANAAQTGNLQSDDGLTHHRASGRRTASFWIKMGLENNEFCTSWDTVCTIIAVFQQEVATRRQHCTFFYHTLEIFPPPSSSSWRLTLDPLSCLSTCSGRDGSYSCSHLWRLCSCDCGHLVFLHVQMQHAESSHRCGWCVNVFRIYILYIYIYYFTLDCIKRKHAECSQKKKINTDRRTK